MSDDNDDSDDRPPAHELPAGSRKTGNIELLVTEAVLHDDGKGGTNPARPINGEIAKQAIEKIEGKGLEPAWRQVENGGEFP